MDSVGFLVTGFSGDLALLVVRYPDGSEVDSNAADAFAQVVNGEHNLDVWSFTDDDTDTNFPTLIRL